MSGPVVTRIVERVLNAYSTCGRFDFAYGQGSTFSGFETEADVDIVLIWPQSIPPGQNRPADELCDSDIDPVQFEDPEFALDNLVIGGREVQAAHYGRSTFDSWCRLVDNGEGWHGRQWPLPLHAVAGFVYGISLADHHGEATAIRERIATPTAKLRTRTRETVAAALSEYDKLLTSSARRAEGWLFHQLSLPFIKQAYAAWFAAEGHYLPFPKHLDRWIERLGLDQELARAEQRIWRLSDLLQRKQAIMDFAECVVSIDGAPARG